jgi:hypothetical protein
MASLRIPFPCSEDVPHLSESVLIGIETWQFVESGVNEWKIFCGAVFLLRDRRFSFPAACVQRVSARQLLPLRLLCRQKGRKR